MAFLAKLFINSEERNVLDAAFLYNQLVDHSGRPKTDVKGGLIDFIIESTKNDELFYDWMFSDHTTYNGYIRFYKRDGYSKLFDYEFANCYCVGLKEYFNASGTENPRMKIKLSPGIQRVRGIIFEKKWNPDNPYINQVAVTEREVDQEPIIEDMYYTDMDDKKIPNDELQSGMAVYLVLKTKNGVGKDVDIDLDDHQNDFKYNGEALANDIIEDFTIKSDTQKIKLEIIPQKK